MFLSTVTNSLDAKGRVSVPADFRSVIGESGREDGFDGIIVWPSFDGAYLEGGMFPPVLISRSNYPYAPHASGKSP